MAAPSLQPRRPWKGRRVVLGVTGGVAAYKAVQLARDLTRLGAHVEVVLSAGAERFVGALSFEGVTGGPVHRGFSAGGPLTEEAAALHVRLGREAEALVVAPATAEFLSRAAQGRADDLLSTTLLVTRAPVVLCPAMNDRMWSHPQVQANAARCAEVGYRIAGPVAGALAAGEGEGGPGRMLEPAEILEHVGRALGEDAAFRGRTVLVTAGPTREPLDPVRFLGNRSSGRMGYAVAAAAWRRGARVVLVTGPTALEDPVGVEVIRVETALEMRDRVGERVGQAHLAVFAAAVADYRPREARPGKVKRAETGDAWAVELTVNPDVAVDTRTLRRKGAVAVGFALETSALIEGARMKLLAKGFDLMVANDASVEGAGFEVATNQVTFLWPDDRCEVLSLRPKNDVAEDILDRAGAILAERAAP